MISEKTVPYSIRLLKYTILLLFLSLIILISVEMSFKIDFNASIEESVQAIYDSYKRHSIMVSFLYII
jgi:hypothetical protein